LHSRFIAGRMPRGLFEATQKCRQEKLAYIIAQSVRHRIRKTSDCRGYCSARLQKIHEDVGSMFLRNSCDHIRGCKHIFHEWGSQLSGEGGTRKYVCKLAFRQFQITFTDRLRKLRIDIILFFCICLFFPRFLISKNSSW
jgi:hypothetical protein